MFPINPKYVPNPEVARLLSQLIEFGYAPEELPEMNAEWATAYDAVKRVSRHGRRDRWQTFLRVTRRFEMAYEMSCEVTEYSSGAEDRESKTRIFYTAKDAMHKPPMLKWLVDGLIMSSSVNFFVGDPGAKKTLLAIDLAVCVAMGKPWLGFTTKEGAALFVDEETGIQRLWGSMHAALNGHDAPVGTPLDFVSLGGYDLRKEEDANALMHRALDFDSRLIVIDALADITRGGEENNVSAMQPIVFNLRRLAEACQAAVVVIHHKNRKGAFRGSSAIAAGADLMLGVESTADDGRVNLRAIKSRHRVPAPFVARVHFENAEDGMAEKTWFERVDEPAPAARGPREPGAAKRILKYLTENEEAMTGELASELGYTVGTVRGAINELNMAGLIERREVSVDGKRTRLAVFRLRSVDSRQMTVDR